MSWFSWSKPYYRSPRREPSEVVTDTLMLELSWQMREAERLHHERDDEYRRVKSGVDYSWLMSTPHSRYDISQGERLGLEDLCSKVPPSYCGSLIQRFRQVLLENEPEVQEVSGLFRSAIVETLECVQEEQEDQRLIHQWNNKRSISLSLLSFKSRVRINPFSSTLELNSNSYGSEEDGVDVKTVCGNVEKSLGLTTEKAPRVWSMPECRHNGINGKESMGQ
ncbi:protein RD3-like [Xyrauchen texanus]|uniref:protein RD3-like n=1 Tax=Xyrauchen texanus TaxID=154827 RepID=UPI0022427E18|nr:protein RD3-like [Xyrauchen texanus]